eukprot:CAMPEP_0180297820 /NCGR_PEP_ID=MMETSP0988-20121125/20785_1 /TAXON_ID=697907 /ORGANISM="non described non described, Strain CCMP2293" /LENGTH=73 /DNA_ID=CAMNT_0022276589 /DNA_START=39 /DNA_END=260 /DNA_ORIENTATION=+
MQVSCSSGPTPSRREKGSKLQAAPDQRRPRLGDRGGKAIITGLPHASTAWGEVGGKTPTFCPIDIASKDMLSW